ncbi:MAG: hypothetical protein A4E28_02984 [Methanocella sp. PtaU1.Bin125]|nr:MAG: hypothetical protein A4E28_02984 [Methanocella sp. PtaU1.Bin125]
MTNPTVDASMNKMARKAGWLYLLLALCFLFSTMYVDSRLYVTGDAAATVSNIHASEGLFRLGIVSILVGQIAFMLLVNELYTLLKSVDRGQARLMLILVVAGVAAGCLNMATKCAPLLLSNGAGYLAAFDPAQLDGLAMLSLDLYRYGVYVVDIFWSLWLIPLGLLVYKSGFFPRVMGVLLLIGSIGYLLVSFKLLLPNNEAISTGSSVFVMISTMAEFIFVFWLLLKGVNIRRAEQGPA